MRTQREGKGKETHLSSFSVALLFSASAMAQASSVSTSLKLRLCAYIREYKVVNFTDGKERPARKRNSLQNVPAGPVADRLDSPLQIRREWHG